MSSPSDLGQPPFVFTALFDTGILPSMAVGGLGNALPTVPPPPLQPFPPLNPHRHNPLTAAAVLMASAFGGGGASSSWLFV